MTNYSVNRKASYDYFLEKTFECGIILLGSEVKSVRASKISLKESYVKIINSEVFLLNSHISLNTNVSDFTKRSYDETRPRKLLLTKKEIKYLSEASAEDGYTIIGTKVYQPEDSNKIKIQIALGKGKKLYDKRETIKERDLKRYSERNEY